MQWNVARKWDEKNGSMKTSFRKGWRLLSRIRLNVRIGSYRRWKVTVNNWPWLVGFRCSRCSTSYFNRLRRPRLTRLRSANWNIRSVFSLESCDSHILTRIDFIIINYYWYYYHINCVTEISMENKLYLFCCHPRGVKLVERKKLYSIDVVSRLVLAVGKQNRNWKT